MTKGWLFLKMKQGTATQDLLLDEEYSIIDGLNGIYLS